MVSAEKPRRAAQTSAVQIPDQRLCCRARVEAYLRASHCEMTAWLTRASCPTCTWDSLFVFIIRETLSTMSASGGNGSSSGAFFFPLLCVRHTDTDVKQPRTKTKPHTDKQLVSILQHGRLRVAKTL
jgi:hypothetical protein